MLGMALDAAPLRFVEGLGEAGEYLFARPRRMPRGEQHRGRRIRVRHAHRLVLAGVTSDARLVGHRDERFDMARLAIRLQAGVRARQRPRQPSTVGMIAVGALVHLPVAVPGPDRPEQEGEHTSELQSLMRISYDVFCLKKKKKKKKKRKDQSNKQGIRLREDQII